MARYERGGGGKKVHSKKMIDRSAGAEQENLNKNTWRIFVVVGRLAKFNYFY